MNFSKLTSNLVLASLLLPVAVMNILSGIVALVWLVVLKEWAFVLICLTMMPFALFWFRVGILLQGLVLLPIVMLAGFLNDRMGKPFVAGTFSADFLFHLVGQIGSSAVVTALCLLVLRIATEMTEGLRMFTPALIASYSVATLPILWIAQNLIDFMLGLVLQWAYFLAIIAILFFSASFTDAAVLFCAVMLIGSIVNASIAGAFRL
ncbi:MAG: hypothetical protein MPK11_07170 [Gammaproteobacteria bacterium]|nr:hypothetical protein [Gammaproteobacteria bacterium]CAJ2377526.1 MAG: membrane hypothetical protein [Arenicellales bacterium IbO2]MDA7961158.1 hypothetical protein [Gammaproteobacteria bacterium]MDA7970542.1 hypothetical protein [Gammaproteobacteria bacterium]MDA7994823.1 hypothetical protein [Gammaproteobacteria bacterium]